MKNYRLEKCLSIKNISEESYKDLVPFYELLKNLTETASKQTHYHNLDKWSDEVFNYVHKMLKKYKFKNGKPEENKKIPDASFWWEIYGLLSSIIWSPNLKTKTANHHSSAWERNEALKKDLEEIISDKDVLCNIGDKEGE